MTAKLSKKPAVSSGSISSLVNPSWFWHISVNDHVTESIIPCTIRVSRLWSCVRSLCAYFGAITRKIRNQATCSQFSVIVPVFRYGQVLAPESSYPRPMVHLQLLHSLKQDFERRAEELMPNNDIRVGFRENVEYVVEHFSFASSSGHLSFVTTSLFEIWRELFAERSHDGVRCMVDLFRWRWIINVVGLPYRSRDGQNFLIVGFVVDDGSDRETHHREGRNVLWCSLVGLRERVNILGIIDFDFQATPRGLFETGGQSRSAWSRGS